MRLQTVQSMCLHRVVTLSWLIMMRRGLRRMTHVLRKLHLRLTSFWDGPSALAFIVVSGGASRDYEHLQELRAGSEVDSQAGALG